MQNIFFKTGIVLSLIIVSSLNIYGQKPVNKKEAFPRTVAPFLTITPESRGGAMGDAGVATAPDINSQHWNSSKYAFLEQDMGVALSYTPWLRDLVDDINLYYLTFFRRIDKMQTVSASLRYFSLGTITFLEDKDAVPYIGKPNEFAIDAAYSLKLSDNISGSVAFRYIRSDIYNGAGLGSAVPGNAFAADLNFFYLQQVKWGGRKGDVSAGINISNIGSKISYDGGTNQQFLPANLRLGGAYTVEIDRYNKVGFTVDVNRYMVTKGEVVDGIVEDKDDLSVPASFFQSFGDFAVEDLRISVGGEYWYDNQFAIRAGYYHEDEIIGNRKFATAGAGLKFNMFTIDASYIIAIAQTNPLANTIRFTLGFDLDKLGK